MTKIKAIAIFHGLGDCVNSTSLIKPIRTAYPDHKLIWITAERYLPLVANNPLVDQTISIPGCVWQADKKYDEFKKKYPGLIQPAPYRWPPSKNNQLLESFEDRILHYTKKKAQLPLEPLLYVTHEEVAKVDEWLMQHKISKYVMLESIFTSSQSFWNPRYTRMVLKIMAKKGYTVLLTHRSDDKLEEYRKLANVYCLDFNFRAMPRFYNRSSGFIGVSSGISCIVHTHQCSKNIPHLEFVGGEHWCTRKYPKNNKIISFNKNHEHVKQLINKAIPTL